MKFSKLAAVAVAAVALQPMAAHAQAAPLAAPASHPVTALTAATVPTTMAGVQADLDAVMHRVPGGTQISSHEVAWRHGDVVYSVPLPGSPEASAHPSTPLAITDCPDDWLCLWQGTFYNYRMIRFTNTGYMQDIRSYFQNVNSYYDHRAQRAFLHYDLNPSGTEICVSPGARNAQTAPWINNHTQAVYLANSSSC